jgi:hypothetical protein
LFSAIFRNRLRLRAASLLLLLVYFKYCRPRLKAFPIDRAEFFVTFDPFSFGTDFRFQK